MTVFLCAANLSPGLGVVPAPIAAKRFHFFASVTYGRRALRQVLWKARVPATRRGPKSTRETGWQSFYDLYPSRFRANSCVQQQG